MIPDFLRDPEYEGYSIIGQGSGTSKSINISHLIGMLQVEDRNASESFLKFSNTNYDQ